MSPQHPLVQNWIPKVQTNSQEGYKTHIEVQKRKKRPEVHQNPKTPTWTNQKNSKNSRKKIVDPIVTSGLNMKKEAKPRNQNPLNFKPSI